MANFLYVVFSILFVLLCLIMMGAVLIQRGRGGGLSSAFGGAGNQSAFGSKTGDMLTWATSIIFALFLLTSIGLYLVVKHIYAPPNVKISDTRVKEGNTGKVPAVFTLKLNKSWRKQVKIEYDIVEKTGKLAEDVEGPYSGAILIPADAREAQIVVNVKGNTGYQGTREFQLKVKSEGAVLDRDVATGVIEEDDAPGAVETAPATAPVR